MKFTIFLAVALITLHMVAGKPMRPHHGNGMDFVMDNDTIMVTAKEPTGPMESPAVQVQPYNILNTQHVCPDGFILANNHCHKRIK